MADGRPRWADAQVSVADPDPRWPELAVDLAASLGAALGPHRRSDVVHVGSTAVPGLRAKPVIDLMVVVDDLEDACSRRRAELVARRWVLVPPALDARPWRRLLVRPTADGGGRAAHLHLLPPGSPRWDEQIAFRDALRADRDLADEYAQLKTDLAAAYADREAYTDGKADFVRRVLADARPAR